jgi:molybdopterin-biosynthesis enzyme MoeA-like protein
MGGSTALFDFLGGTWFPITNGVLQHIAKLLPSYWLVQASHVALGGAPGFVIQNVWVLPGLPSEMEAMFDLYAGEFRGEELISSWRRAYRTRESEIVSLLAGATVRWPQVRIGSYPRFLPDGPEVEIVLKSANPKKLAEAVAWLEPNLETAASAASS